MANRADNFAYVMSKVWNDELPNTATYNAVKRAELQGAVRISAVISHDHWIDEPGDELGWLYEWPDGSRYVVGQNGSWIQSCKGRGRRTIRYEDITDGN